MEQQTQENTFVPVFEQIEDMTQEQAINVLIQCAGLAQQSGKLNIKDSVLLAKAITLLSPGSL